MKTKIFNYFISICIFVNTVTLAMDGYPINEIQEEIIEYINILFYFVFLMEMFFKLAGFGFKEYVRTK